MLRRSISARIRIGISRAYDAIATDVTAAMPRMGGGRCATRGTKTEILHHKHCEILVISFSEREMFDPLVPSANPLRARILVGHMSNQCEKKEDSHHKVSKKNLKNLFYENEASYSYHKEWP